MEKREIREDHLVHSVYFTLLDCSSVHQKKLVEDCYTYLKDHSGIASFFAGVLADDMSRSVNDMDFDVALTIVFENKEAHNLYQVSPKHKEFLRRNKESWMKVRVFDSYVCPGVHRQIKDIPAVSQKKTGVINQQS